ncbi:ricin B-like lectin R40G3 [Cornus florida]|uniref:ricin B-like lectin R40G3 n=1 Tax=Cornus florida TaxID=4283 RepID=UPI00289B97FE|nr:ricin B-like lectin R40G3 [Cornus florida]
MDYPFGHHSHTHHHRADERDEDYPPPPPPNFGHPPPPPPSYYAQNEPPPPPPSYYAQNEPTHVYHSSHVGGESDYYAQPPPPRRRPESEEYNYSDSHNYPPPQTQFDGGYSSVQHVSHQTPTESENNPHHYQPHVPSFLHHHTHHEGGSDLADKPAVRVFSKAEENYSLTIRDGKVVLARSDPSDQFQHWIKDEKFSIRVKDEEKFPSFALVNKATGQAIKHSIGATHPVQLIPYNPDTLDESILWTLSRDLGDGFRTIRMVNNIKLNVDAFNGDKNHGGVHDGTTIVLWEWKKGDNQRWKIVPY